MASIPAAENSDIHGHWAQATFKKWIDKGWLSGYPDGTYRPDNTLTRAEFMRFLNIEMGYTEAIGNVSAYTDVKPGDWFYNDISIAVNKGYISGVSSTKMAPNDNITNEQAISIVSRINNFESGDVSVLASVKDSSDISSWASQSVASAISSGYVAGDKGSLHPQKNITRAEAIALLDRTYTGERIYSFPGTYGPATGVLYAKDNVTITVPDITIRNMNIAKDLTVAQSVGEGAVHVDSVRVNGDTYVNGGGVNSIYFNNFTSNNWVYVERERGSDTVRLVLTGDSNANVELRTNAIIVTQTISDGSKVTVEIPKYFLGTDSIELVGNFASVVNNKEGSKIEINGSVGSLTLNVQTSVTGQNKIDTLNVSKEAVGSSISTKPNNIAGEGKNSVSTGSSTSSGNTSGSGSGGGSYSPPSPPSSSGDFNLPTATPVPSVSPIPSTTPVPSVSPEPEVIPVTGIRITHYQYTEDGVKSIDGGVSSYREQLNVEVTPEDATDKTVKWSSSNTDAVIVDSNGGCTRVGLGNAVITATAGDFSDSVTVHVGWVAKSGYTLTEGLSTDRLLWLAA